ncbi:phage tail protein [Paenibacillus sp. y28]|uniref:phage tail protein n=1 Tax=Paenibacillus sp. y28 TaxID=3129110 RepID=UPI00301AD6DE
MGDWFIGEIRLFSFDFAPRGWAQCNGQVMLINQNQALYSLIGTSFGGDGKTTFQLPNLQGKAVLNPNAAAGIPLYMTAGEEAHTLTMNEIPQHTHSVIGSTNTANLNAATNNVWGAGSAMGYSSAASGTMSSAAIANAGSSQAHSNMQPYAVVNFCIALQGVFPPHSQ